MLKELREKQNKYVTHSTSREDLSALNFLRNESTLDLVGHRDRFNHSLDGGVSLQKKVKVPLDQKLTNLYSSQPMFMHDEAHSSNIDAKDSLLTNSLVINDRAE